MIDQGKLFNIKPIIIPRPTIANFNSDKVYSELAEEICEWLEEDEEGDLLDVTTYLKKKFSISDLRNLNGYQLCKELERDSYDPDENLVEIMSNTSYVVSKEFANAQKEWVSKCEIEPRLNIGDIVEVSYYSKRYKAEIKQIKSETAHYMCHIPEHMTENSLLYVNFEEVELDFYTHRKQ